MKWIEANFYFKCKVWLTLLEPVQLQKIVFQGKMALLTYCFLLHFVFARTFLFIDENLIKNDTQANINALPNGVVLKLKFQYMFYSFRKQYNLMSNITFVHII